MPSVPHRNAADFTRGGAGRGVVRPSHQKNLRDTDAYAESQTEKEKLNRKEELTNACAEEKIVADTVPDFVAASEKQIAIANSNAAAVRDAGKIDISIAESDRDAYADRDADRDDDAARKTRRAECDVASRGDQRFRKLRA